MSGPEPWRSAVVASPTITDATRVLLLDMWITMRRDGRVSVPRAEIARRLGRSERRIDERVAAAVAAGYLAVASPGHRGHTAVYVATLPESATPVGRALRTGKGDPRGSRTQAEKARRSAAPFGIAKGRPPWVAPVFIDEWHETQPQERSESEHTNGTGSPVAVKRPAQQGDLADRPGHRLLAADLPRSPQIAPTSEDQHLRAGFGGDLTR